MKILLSKYCTYGMKSPHVYAHYLTFLYGPNLWPQGKYALFYESLFLVFSLAVDKGESSKECNIENCLSSMG